MTSATAETDAHRATGFELYAIRTRYESLQRCMDIADVVQARGLVRARDVLPESGKFPGNVRPAEIGLRKLSMKDCSIDAHAYYKIFTPDFTHTVYLFAEFDGRVASSIADMVRQPMTSRQMVSLRWRLKNGGLSRSEIDKVASYVETTDPDLKREKAWIRASRAYRALVRTQDSGGP